MTLEEFMQQKATEKGYIKSPLRYIYDDGPEEIDQNRLDFQDFLSRGVLKRIDPKYGVMEDYQVGEAEAPGYDKRFASREQELKNEYYADPSNFIQARETPFVAGVNTFNEGNENQKRILDQINTGQLRIVPVSYEVDTFDPEQPYSVRTGYELKDARTGQTIQQVTPIDEAKGFFNIVADDRNSSGYFNNYVSTDPKGFVNPVVSEEQSQYASRPNSSLNFIKNSVKGLLSLAAIAATAGGAGASLGSLLGTGTTAGNLALNAGVNLLKQGVTGEFDPLDLATSTALSYGLGGADGTDAITADDLDLGRAMTDYRSSLDATDLINSFADAGLTASKIDQLTREAVETGTQLDAYTSPIDTPVIGQPYDVTPLTDPFTGEPFGTIEDPLTFVSETGLATLPDEGMQTDLPGTTLLEEIGLYTDGFDPAPRYDFSPETPVLDVSPELDPTGSMATSRGFGITPRQLLTGANIARSLLGSGQEQAVAPATQFKGTRVPQGKVDYSGILSLLQMQSPQRRSLLG